MPLSHRLRRLLSAALLAVAVPVAAGCGGGGDADADPAAIVPAGAPVYFEANLAPGEDVTELARKLSGEDDPGAAIRREIERSARENGNDLNFSEDVDPWLGERVGVYVARVTAGDDADVAAVVPTTDVDEARETLERELRRGSEGEPEPQVVERTHRETEYLVNTTDDEALAFIDDYAVTGSDAAVRGAIDADEGDALADDERFGEARDAVEDDGVGFGYVRVEQLFGALGPQGAAARQVLAGLGDTVALGLDGDENAITLESATLGVEGEEAEDGGPGEVLGQLPGDAWLAAGTADFGSSLQRAIERFSQLGGLAGQDPERFLEQLEQQLGVDPRRDLADWMGDVGIFAVGESPQDLGGGLVAQTTDAAATRRSIPRLARFVERNAQGVQSSPLDRDGVETGVTLSGPELELPVHMALTGDDRFVVAVSDAALDRVLEGGEALSESQAWRDASGRLGEGFEPRMFLNFEPLPGLLDAAGAGEDPNVARVQQALERLTTLVAGGQRDGDVQRGRLVVGVR